jgi:hypothetical protein
MWIRDVNNYIAEPVGARLRSKTEGRLLVSAQLPGRHFERAAAGMAQRLFRRKSSIMAAVAHMVEGVDIEEYIYAHRDPFDFMCRAKVDRSSQTDDR